MNIPLITTMRMITTTRTMATMATPTMATKIMGTRITPVTAIRTDMVTGTRMR